MSTQALVSELKQNDQDFEWYPTTDEIINRIKRDLGSEFSGSVLDIGAGNGKVLKAITQGNKYAIEKSKILIDNMDKDIFIVGTDFYHQTLIDKQVDVIFCNPPYKDYRTWAEKIILEANAGQIYLVIPDRWHDRKGITKAIEIREGKYKILGNYDFADAERRARCKVQLVKIDLRLEGYYTRDTVRTDPFMIWFKNNFEVNADRVKAEYEVKRSKQEKLKSLVTKENLIPQLEKFYQADLKKLIGHYKALESLDPELLKELEVNLDGACEALKMKIEGIKYVYWGELFDNLDAITDRLTSFSRGLLLDTLTSNTNIDFTAGNAYSVVVWAIKNANEYMDDQLRKVYLDLSDRDNVTLYKSNHRIIDDGWRYQKREMSHYKLDYRIIHYFYHTFDGHSFQRKNDLHDSAIEFIGDIITIAKNLGFIVETDISKLNWVPGRKQIIYCSDGSVFCEIRAYKNGNLHFKFKPEFMKKFNIEAARLNMWIKSPKEAEEELNISEDEAEQYFGINYQIGARTTIGMLLEGRENE